jgi:hypothetical protein
MVTPKKMPDCAKKQSSTVSVLSAFQPHRSKVFAKPVRKTEIT